MAAQVPDWYGVLGVPPSASSDEIRQAFRQAALRLHPDKASAAATGAGGGLELAAADGTTAAAEAADVGAEAYRRVQQAWEVLQDAERRAVYDRQLALAAAAAQVNVNETIPLAVLAAESVDGLACHVWPCRCGGSYYLLEEDAQTAQAAAAADAAAAAAAASAAAMANASEARPAELLVPCSTCSLYIRVLAPPA